ncbi:MAG TPA: hypothetical protein VFP30_02775 [Candidatus Limnocylindria bacterium]|nr:hypothetical protein [Candidatus Limnocylindria bacterium]
MRGVAALAVISLAIAGCQNEGAGESLDTLPSVDTGAPSESMDMGSMDMGSPSAEPSESAAP